MRAIDTECDKRRRSDRVIRGGFAMEPLSPQLPISPPQQRPPLARLQKKRALSRKVDLGGHRSEGKLPPASAGREHRRFRPKTDLGRESRRCIAAFPKQPLIQTAAFCLGRRQQRGTERPIGSPLISHRFAGFVAADRCRLNITRVSLATWQMGQSIRLAAADVRIFDRHARVFE